MKYVKTFGIAAAAVLGLMSLGVGTASATKLCTDGPCATVYATGTSLELTLKSETSANFTSAGGETLNTCTGSTITGATSNESGGYISTFGESVTWSGCSHTTDTSGFPSGSLDFEWVLTDSGKVRHTGNPVTMTLFSVSCTYEGFEGNLTGGKAPTVSIATSTMVKVAGGFLCPGFVFLDAEYVITKPHAIHIAS